MRSNSSFSSILRLELRKIRQGQEFDGTYSVKPHHPLNKLHKCGKTPRNSSKCSQAKNYISQCNVSSPLKSHLRVRTVCLEPNNSISMIYHQKSSIQQERVYLLFIFS